VLKDSPAVSSPIVLDWALISEVASRGLLRRNGDFAKNQVAVLNRVFSPPPEKVEHTRRAVEAFETGLRNGTASVGMDGTMVDTPVCRRAKRILEQAAAIAKVEKRKAERLARLR